jgi:hypothetical protein
VLLLAVRNFLPAELAIGSTAATNMPSEGTPGDHESDHITYQQISERVVEEDVLVTTNVLINLYTMLYIE